MNIKRYVRSVFRSLGFDLVRYDPAFKRKIQTVRVKGNEIVFWIANLTGYKWYAGEKYFDHIESIELLKLIRPGMRILEIGCNHGLFTCLMAKATGPNGKVVAVDCIAENVMISQANASANYLNNLTVLQYAVAEQALGEVRVDSSANGFVVSSPVAGDTEDSESISIDELSKKYGPFDLLKIDVEGYEGHVLRGAKNTLAEISALAVEIHGGGAGLERYNSSPREVVQLINPFGFSGVCFNAAELARHTRSTEVTMAEYDPCAVPNAHLNLFLHKLNK